MTDDQPEAISYYGSYYRDFAADVYAEIRREEFGEDLGQNNWQTRAELDGFAAQLEARRSGAGLRRRPARSEPARRGRGIPRARAGGGVGIDARSLHGRHP